MNCPLPRCLYLVAIFCMILKLIKTEAKVDAGKSKAWGPGLAPSKLVFPARYFFVQLYDEHGEIVTNSSNGGLDVHISGDALSKPCRVWSNILNRKDGSFIVRYKLYEPCNNLKIDLRYENMPVDGFPKYFNEKVISDNCNCPQPLNTWLNSMQCKSNYTQIYTDLKRFQKIDFKDVHKRVLNKFHNHGSVSLCHYIVKDNIIYRKCYGQYVDFHIFVDAVLLSLTRKVHLPDFEAFFNLGDWPLEKSKQDPLPIFSWCGSQETADIVMPTYDITEATLECMGRVQLDMLSVQGNTGPSWDDKIGMAFWRGRDSRQERLQLVEMSRKFPQLLNASLTFFFFFRDQKDRYGPAAELVPFFDFFQYKYQVTLDGTVAAYRLPYLLAGDSVVLKQESPYYEHFYRDLRPGIDYVPFKRDLSDLVDKIKWLMENEEQARMVSKNGQGFARANLMPADVLCYHAVLFKEWSSRLKTPPEILPEMVRVEQPDTEPCSCPVVDDLRDEL